MSMKEGPNSRLEPCCGVRHGRSPGRFNGLALFALPIIVALAALTPLAHD